jgi:hypothetical protein
MPSPRGKGGGKEGKAGEGSSKTFSTTWFEMEIMLSPRGKGGEGNTSYASYGLEELPSPPSPSLIERGRLGEGDTPNASYRFEGLPSPSSPPSPSFFHFLKTYQ